MNKTWKDWPSQSRENQRAYQKKRTLDQWNKLFEYMGGKCKHCGVDEHCPAIYDLHHVDPSTKDHSIAKIMRRRWEVIKEEADKCILLCSNCHRKVHYEQGGGTT